LERTCRQTHDCCKNPAIVATSWRFDTFWVTTIEHAIAFDRGQLRDLSHKLLRETSP